MGFADTLDQILTQGFQGLQMGEYWNKMGREKEIYDINKKLKGFELAQQERLNAPKDLDPLLKQQFQYGDKVNSFIKTLAESSGALDQNGKISGVAYKELMHNIYSNPAMVHQVNSLYRTDLGSANESEKEKFFKREAEIKGMEPGEAKQRAMDAYDKEVLSYRNNLEREFMIADLPDLKAQYETTMMKTNMALDPEIKSQQLRNLKMDEILKGAHAKYYASGGGRGGGGAAQFQKWLAQKDFLDRQKFLGGGAHKAAGDATAAYLSSMSLNDKDPNTKALYNFMTPYTGMLATQLRLSGLAGNNYDAMRMASAAANTFHGQAFRRGNQMNLVPQPANTVGGNAFANSMNQLAGRVQRGEKNILAHPAFRGMPTVGDFEDAHVVTPQFGNAVNNMSQDPTFQQSIMDNLTKSGSNPLEY